MVAEHKAQWAETFAHWMQSIVNSTEGNAFCIFMHSETHRVLSDKQNIGFAWKLRTAVAATRSELHANALRTAVAATRGELLTPSGLSFTQFRGPQLRRRGSLFHELR